MFSPGLATRPWMPHPNVAARTIEDPPEQGSADARRTGPLGPVRRSVRRRCDGRGHPEMAPFLRRRITRYPPKRRKPRAGKATASEASGSPSPGLVGMGGMNPFPLGAVKTSVPKGSSPVWAA